MEFEKETPILVHAFHYDLNEKPTIQNQVNVAFRKAAKKDDKGGVEPAKDGTYFEVAVVFNVAPAPGDFSVSGQISQIVKLKDYYGDGKDLSKTDYRLLSRPLVEYIETLTYQVTEITMEKPVNLNFEANF